MLSGMSRSLHVLQIPIGASDQGKYKSRLIDSAWNSLLLQSTQCHHGDFHSKRFLHWKQWLGFEESIHRSQCVQYRGAQTSCSPSSSRYKLPDSAVLPAIDISSARRSVSSISRGPSCLLIWMVVHLADRPPGQEQMPLPSPLLVQGSHLSVSSNVEQSKQSRW